MVTEIQHTNIRRVLDDLTEHPMLSSLTLEQAVRYTLKFIARHGYACLYEDKTAPVEIRDFRGLLPCDLISIRQVRDTKTGICLRSMTDSFPEGMRNNRRERDCVDPMNNMRHTPYIPPMKGYVEEPSFKTQGRVIFTSFPDGLVEIAYKAIPVDEDGFPLLIDDETYIDALEQFIKARVFEVKFDQQKIPAGVLQNAQQQSAVSARLLQSQFTVPSPSEMESLGVIWNTMIPRMREFSKGFRNLGDREYLRNQNNIK